MKRTTTTLLGAALVALSAGSWAADTSTTAAPNAAATTPEAQPGAQPSVKNMDSNAQRMHGRNSQKAPAEQGEQPTTQNMDANAQRAHSRSQGTEAGTADAAQSKGKTGGTSTADAKDGAQVTRDWAQIDANHDNSVSPDEMQKYLDGQHSKSATTTDSAAPAAATKAAPAKQ